MNSLDSPHLVDAYDRLLGSVGRAAPEVGDGRLTSHWPLVGRNFDHGVLVVGQAVYGWIPDWTAPDATSAAGRSAILDDTKSDVLRTRRSDELDRGPSRRELAVLAHGPRGHRRAGARSRESLVQPRRVGQPLPDRARAPTRATRKGRCGRFRRQRPPNSWARSWMRFAPRLVLVLAGPFIWSFVEPLDLGGLARAAPPFTLVGQTSAGVPWICGMHPGGAQRRGWPARLYAELIIAEAAKASVQGL